MRDYQENVFVNQVTRNKYVWMAIVFCAVILILTYFIPGLRSLLSIQELDMRIWGLIAVASILPVTIIQLIKGVIKF